MIHELTPSDMWAVGVIVVVVASHVRLEVTFGAHKVASNARIKRLEQLAGIAPSEDDPNRLVRDETCNLRHSAATSEMRAMHSENLRAIGEMSTQVSELRRAWLERG